MRKNPRPIPFFYESIFELADDIYEGIFYYISMFEGSECEDIEFSESWRREYRHCFESSGKPIAQSINVIPIDYSLTDLYGNHYNLTSCLIHWQFDLSGTVSGLSTLQEFLQGASVVKDRESALYMLEQANEIESQTRLRRGDQARMQKKRIEAARILEDGASLNIQVSLMFTPRRLLEYVLNNRRQILHRLQELLVHELTHIRDVQLVLRGKDYYNYPHEVRAEMQRIAFMLWRDLVWEQSLSWEQDFVPRFQNENIDEIFWKYINSDRVAWNLYTPKNQHKIRSMIIQWLNESGFRIPRR